MVVFAAQRLGADPGRRRWEIWKVKDALDLDSLREGHQIRLRLRGHTLSPYLKRGQLCVVEPVDPQDVRVGEVVLARPRKAWAFYFVGGKDATTQSLKLVNGRGRVVGWRNYFYIAGRMKEPKLMRDPARVPQILDRLRAIWERHPDLRLAQVIMAADMDTGRLFNMEDELLITRLEKRFRSRPLIGGDGATK